MEEGKEDTGNGCESSEGYPGTETEKDGDGAESAPDEFEEDITEMISTPEGLNYAEIDPLNDSQVFCCDKCSISFVSPEYLEGHAKRCRATRMDESTRAKTTDTQSLDGEIITPPRKKSRKERKGEMKYNCKLCGKGFIRLSYLIAHEASHKDLFKCDKCPYTTDYRRNLSRHMVVHYGEEDKIYACPHCSYTAGKSSYLRKHVAKHAEVKPFKCNLCSYETAISANLEKHKVVHGGEKAFPCPHCYYSTARKIHLTKHVEKFHPAQSEAVT